MMKVELIKEEKYKQDPWYEIRIDDNYLWGTSDKDKADEEFRKVTADPEIAKTKESVLLSKEI